MSYEPYATESFYHDKFQGHSIPNSDLKRHLLQASRHIDSLTYNRIVGRGFNNLTDFQKDIIQEVCCLQAEFEYHNKEILEMVMQGYSINGVNMQFGDNWSVKIVKGVPVRRDVYEQLSQTGLCCNSFAVR